MLFVVNVSIVKFSHFYLFSETAEQNFTKLDKNSMSTTKFVSDFWDRLENQGVHPSLWLAEAF